MCNGVPLSHFFFSDNEVQRKDTFLTLQESRRSGRQLKATHDISKMNPLDRSSFKLENSTVSFKHVLNLNRCPLNN